MVCSSHGASFKLLDRFCESLCEDVRMLRFEVEARPEANAVVTSGTNMDPVQFKLSNECISLRDILTVDCLESAEGTWALDEIWFRVLKLEQLVVKIRP